MQDFHSHGVKFSYHATHDPVFGNDRDKPVVIWAHGWGHTHRNFMPLMAPFEHTAHHIMLDFPGFGESSIPPADWGTEEYADAIAVWLAEQNAPPVLWVGHSFGCRIGLQLVARHPERIKAMALIAGAGLQRKLPPHKALYTWLVKHFPVHRLIPRDHVIRRALRKFFGSADYKTAGPLRDIFIRVIAEDLTAQAQNVQCPVTLIYGKDDTETPPEFGERFSRLIPNAKLFLLDGQDHYTVLDSGRHHVVKILHDFLEENVSAQKLASPT